MKAPRFGVNWLQALVVVLFVPWILISAVMADAIPTSPLGGGAIAEFRNDDGAVDRKLGVSLLASFGILALGAAAVVLSKRKVASAKSNDVRGNIKVLEVKRVTRAITVVSLETADGRSIVFAENSQSLLLLSGDSRPSSLGKDGVTPT